ncbi:MAG: GHKL domain-containing protein [Eubacteriaceae bacterium]
MKGMDFYVGVEVLAIGFETISIYYWARIFSDKREKNKWIMLILNCSTVLILLGMLLGKNSLLLLGITSMLAFFQLFYRNKKVGTSIFLALVYCVIAVLAESLTMFILMIFNDSSLQEILYTYDARVIGHLISKNIMIILIVIAGTLLKNITKKEIPNLKTITYLGVLPLSSILILYQLGENLYENFDGVNSIASLIGTLGLVVGNVLVFIFFNREQKYEQQKMKALFQEEQIIKQKEHYKSMENNSQEIRRIHHDIKNMIIVLSAYAKQGKLAEINKCLDNMEISIEKFAPSIYTGYVGIDSILSEKMNVVKKKKIDFEKKIMFSRNLLVDEMDVCIIIGNVLNNAIEACEKLEVSKRKIIFSINFDEISLTIHTENGIDNSVEQVNNGLIRTTKEDAKNHGFGMSTIQQITEKYQGILEWNIYNEIFVVDIVLFFRNMP